MRVLAPSITVLAEASARHPRIVVALVAMLFVAAAVYLAQNLAVETGTEEMIDPRLEFRQQVMAFNAAFPDVTNTFVAVVEAPVPEAAEEAARALAARLRESDTAASVSAPSLEPLFREEGLLYLDVDTLDQRLAELADAQPLLTRLADAPDLPNLLDLVRQGLDEMDGPPPVSLTTLVDELTVRFDEAAEGRVPEPLSWRQLTAGGSDAPTRHLVTVRPALDSGRLQPAKPALAAAAAAAQEVEAAVPGVTVALTGKLAINAEELASVTEGAILAGSASLVLVTLVLGFGLRSVRLVLAILVTLVVGLAVTGAFGLLAFGSFNVISIAFAVLFIGLGIDFAIHFGLRFQEERGRGLEAVPAIGQSAATAGVALALCAPTTALAFLAFTPTAYTGLAQLGVIAAFGMFVSLVFTLTLLPALLILFRVPQRRAGGAGAAFRLGRGVRRALVVVALALGVGALALLPDVRFDADPLSLKDPNSPALLAFERLADGTGASPDRVSLIVDDAPAAHALADRLAALPEVGDVLWIERFVPDEQETKLALLDDARFFLSVPESAPFTSSATPALREALASFGAQVENPEAAAMAASAERAASAEPAALGALEEAVFRYWPKLLDDLRAALAAEGVTLAALPQSLSARYVAPDGRLHVEVTPQERLEDPVAMTRFVDAVGAVEPAVTGAPVQVVRSGEVVRGAILEATAWAAVVITGFLWLALRGLRAVLLVLVPVALASLLTLGAAVLLGIDFNFANVIVLPLLIGFGVDSAIHVFARAREEGGHDPLDGTTTGRSVVLSSLTTVGSFGTLALSPHAGTASMGQLLTLAVVATMVASLLVLPAVVKLVGSR